MQLSTSLRTLLLSLASESPCCRIVSRYLKRMAAGKPSRLLNPAPMGDYFTFRESEGLITYCPRGREQGINDDGTWQREGRQSMKPAKWLREIIHPRLARRFKDHDFARFATMFKAAEASGKISFEFIDFEDGYNDENYPESSRSTSCMWGEDVGPFYRCFNCELLVAKSADGKYHGRAIVWHQVHGLNTPLMDRVYAKNPEIEHLFFEHAKAQGWARKAEQNNSCFSSYVLPDGTTIHKGTDALRVSPQKSLGHINYWPYLDTFRAMIDDGDLYNSNDEDGAAYLLDCTDGDRTEVDQHEGEVQDVDGDWVDEDNAVQVNSGWYSCDDDRITYCDRSQEYILTAVSYTVEVARGMTYTVHERYVTQN